MNMGMTQRALGRHAFCQVVKPVQCFPAQAGLARAVLPNMVGNSSDGHTNPPCIQVQGPALAGLKFTRAAIAT